MSTTSTTKRSAVKDGAKHSRSASKKKEGKVRSQSSSSKKKDGRKRKSSSSKKDGRKSSVSKKELSSSKRVKISAAAEDAAGTGSTKVVKESARKIDVKWTGRYDSHKKSCWAIRNQPFKRLVQHYAHEITSELSKSDIRLSPFVARSIQSAVEGEVKEVLDKASMLAMHAARTTINGRDITLVTCLSKPIVERDTDKLYAIVQAKREQASKDSKEGGAAAKPRKPKTEGQAPRRGKKAASTAAAPTAPAPAPVATA
jgi:histone H3/H4